MLVMGALSNKEMVTENVFLAHVNELLGKYDKYYPPELQLLTIRGLYAYLIRNFEFIKWSVSWEIFAMTNYQASYRHTKYVKETDGLRMSRVRKKVILLTLKSFRKRYRAYMNHKYYLPIQRVFGRDIASIVTSYII